MIRHYNFAAYMLRRKINPSDYYSKATQLELVQSARALGEAFWLDSIKGQTHGGATSRYG